MRPCWRLFTLHLLLYPVIVVSCFRSLFCCFSCCACYSRTTVSTCVSFRPLDYRSFEAMEMRPSLDHVSIDFMFLYRLPSSNRNTNQLHVSRGILKCRYSRWDIAYLGDFKFHYDDSDCDCGSVITDEGSKSEILSRIAQTTAALTRLKPVWNDRSNSLSSKIRLMRSLVTSIFLYACESRTLTAEPKEEYKPWKWGTIAKYYASHTKTMLPTKKSVPRSSKQSDHMKTWPL